MVDRIVLGLHDRKVQERLLNIPNMDLKGTAEMCRHAEITKVHLQTFREDTVSNEDSIRKKNSVKTKTKVSSLWKTLS